MSRTRADNMALAVDPPLLARPGASRRMLLAADLSMLLITAIWGTTFVLVKEALHVLPPFTFIALRFTLGTAALVLLFGGRLRRLRRTDLHGGLLVGAFLFAGFVLQTLGLQATSASVAAFITGLCVVLVPIVAYCWLGQRPSPGTAAGVGAAAVGLALLSLRDDLSFAWGDLLVLLCAVAFAFQITGVGKFARWGDPLLLALLQLGFVALASWGVALATEHPTLVMTPALAGIVAFMGLVATGLVFAVQNVAQRFTSPTHATLIFTLEPVFAACFAYLWLGEQLSGRAALGALLILAGMLVAELWRKQ